MAAPAFSFAVERLERKHRCTSAARLALILFVLVASAVAQRRADPPVTAYSPTFDVSAGYAFMSSSMPSASRVNLNGADATIGTDFLPHLGVVLDTGYVRTSDVLSTGHPGYTWTFLGGPVFYPLARGTTRPFLHAMAGAALVDSAIPVNGTSYLHGWVERPAYAFGGGIQHAFVGPFGIRIAGDYLRTAYADSTSTVRAQNNIRLTASVMFRLHYGGHRD